MMRFSLVILAFIIASCIGYAVPLNMTTICHYDNETGLYETIKINENALEAHLAQGGYLGECINITINETIINNTNTSVIINESQNIPPNSTPVGRLDETVAARNLDTASIP